MNILALTAPSRAWEDQAGLVAWFSNYWILAKYGQGTHNGNRAQNHNAAADPGVEEFNSRHATVWNRSDGPNTGDDGGSFILCTAGANIKAHAAGDPTQTAELNDASGLTANNLVVPISAKAYIAFGYGGTYGGGALILTACKVVLNDSAWTVASRTQFAGPMGNRMCKSFAFDSSNTLYVAALTLNEVTPESLGSDAQSNAARVESTVALLTSTDYGLTIPKFSELVRYPNTLINGLGSVGGTVYLIATEILDWAQTNFRYRNVVIKFPNTVIWRSPKIYTAKNAAPVYSGTGMVRSISQVSRNELLFIAENSMGSWSVMRVAPDDAVEEIATLPNVSSSHAQTTVHDWMGVERIGNAVYAYDAQNNRITRVIVNGPVTARSLGHSLPLATSKFGGNTSLIEKFPYSVTVELTETLTAESELTVKVNGTKIGSIKKEDGVKKEIILSDDLSAADFIVTVEANESSRWTGELRRIFVRYVPTQFKKKAWGFAVRVDLSQELLNGQREHRTPQQQFDDIEAAWISRKPISYVDKDGKNYTVLVTEFSDRSPLLATRRQDRESIVAIELLEV